MTQDRFEPFFINGERGRLFAILRAPADARRIVILVPPFGEEMDKCRRQFVETARDLVHSGLAVLQFDLHGTGDSDGDFSDGDWDTWKGDLSSAIEWCERQGFEGFALIGLRLGCLLAAESLAERDHRSALSVFIQPVAKGSQFLTQFFRVRVAASMMSDSGKESVGQLRNMLEEGETIEVSGYPVSRSLTHGIEAASLSGNWSRKLGDLHIIEVGKVRADGISPAGQKLLASAAAMRIQASGCRVAGEPFWTATEIVTNDELRKATVGLLAQWSAA